MPQPIPVEPTNVQSNNPYSGLDRGLFVLRGGGEYKCARTHAVSTLCHGPSAAGTVMQYQIMLYKEKPQTPEQYAAGTLATAPDGSTWFDTVARGSVLDPITAEYWTTHSYLTWYGQDDAVKLTDLEKDAVHVQGKAFVQTMGTWVGLTAVELTAAYNAVEGQPLTRTSINLGVDYMRDDVLKHLDISDLPTTAFDAVRVALNAIKTV